MVFYNTESSCLLRGQNNNPLLSEPELETAIPRDGIALESSSVLHGFIYWVPEFLTDGRIPVGSTNHFSSAFYEPYPWVRLSLPQIWSITRYTKPVSLLVDMYVAVYFQSTLVQGGYNAYPTRIFIWIISGLSLG